MFVGKDSRCPIELHRKGTNSLRDLADKIGGAMLAIAPSAGPMVMLKLAEEVGAVVVKDF